MAPLKCIRPPVQSLCVTLLFLIIGICVNGAPNTQQTDGKSGGVVITGTITAEAGGFENQGSGGRGGGGRGGGGEWDNGGGGGRGGGNSWDNKGGSNQGGDCRGRGKGCEQHDGGHDRNNQGSSDCRYWCKTPSNQYYCCENNNHPKPIYREHPGKCPPVRPYCPLGATHSGPQPCNSDDICTYSDKCCYDVCLKQQVCKPAEKGSIPISSTRIFID